MGGHREPGRDSADIHAFPTTHWSIIASARKEERGAALTRLIEAYAPALRTYLTLERRLRPQDVDDALQGFIADRFLESRLLSIADPAKGKFRSLLLSALNNYLASVYRHDSAKKRAPEEGIGSLDSCADHRGDSVEPSAAFVRAWAVQLLTKTQEAMKEECRRINRMDMWEVFRRRELAPCYEGAEPISYDAMVSEFGFKSPLQASNTLVTAKRMFDRILRAQIAEYAMPDQIDDEVRDLFSAFGGAK